MKITLYKMYKRQNSTKQPNEDTISWEIENVQLKDDTSLYHPTFLLSQGLIEFEYSGYNYLKWYDRYYYIDDRVKPTIAGAWEIHCSLDFLATYKEQILDTTAFVLYSTNNFNKMIPDKRLTFPTEKKWQQRSAIRVFPDAEPSIVIDYISAVDSYYGSVAHAVLTPAELKQLNRILMNDTDFKANIDKQLNDTASAIVSCQMFPFTVPASYSTASLDVLGYSTKVSGKIIVNYGVSALQKITFPITETDLLLGDFRDLDPYLTYMIYLPAIGYIDIPSNYIQGIVNAGGTNIQVTYLIDYLTGGIAYNIQGLGKFEGTISVNIPTAYSGINAINTLSSAAGALASAGEVALGNFGSISDAVGSAFNSIISANQKNCGMIGSSSGSRASQLIQPMYSDISSITELYATSYSARLDGPDPASIASTLGRPLNEIIKLSECTGYVQTSKASVALQAPKHVCESVNSMLDSGVYIE